MEATEETTFDLDVIMKEGMDRFNEKLKVAAEDDPITLSKDPKEDPLEKTKGAELTKHTEQELEVKKEPESKKQLRFKSHDDAEKGYRHLQSEKTRVEEKNKELQSRLKVIKEAESRTKAEQEVDTKYLDYSATRHKSALKSIDDLDPDDDAYTDKVARIWAEKDKDVRAFDRANKYEPVEETSTVVDQEEATRQALDIVKSKAEESGLNPEDQYFKMICERTPTTDDSGRQMSFDDQVKWAITQTKNYHAEQHERFQEQIKAEADKKNKEFAAREQPMGRSGGAKTTLSAPVIVSLNDALESAMEFRRL
ncbi:MAG: hypothetical protein ABIL06_13260 [Pseudomonadota bacterium]|uniref:Uncharacterized protein n=1 Tax=viral metagenome TaxID=1070528 RepID=A0A6H1ZG56_9ZZZZ